MEVVVATAGSDWVFFAHGMDGTPWGSKIVCLARCAESLGFRVASPDFRTIADPDRRAGYLVDWVPAVRRRLVLVGSSMGAYAALVASRQLHPEGLFLMAPAVGIPGFGALIDPAPSAGRVVAVHAWEDAVVPVEGVLAFARRHRVPLHLVEDDHRLAATLPEIERLFRGFLEGLLAVEPGVRRA
ncbi:MAG: alpha/beta hydrolase [Magnetococcales bacterium]|nr:alpha/beta hydrolase [Magnetococcales bacterium]MBF0157520.1 alpha/beta hydrolase [Magnetococcales bacterium]